MKRTKKPTEVWIGDRVFTGRTVTEAKQKVAEATEAAFTGVYWPTLLCYRGNTAVVYRDTDGWNYGMIWREDARRVNGCYPTSSLGEKEKEKAYHQAAFHLAQASWVPEDGFTVPDFVQDKEDRSSLISWQRWQLRYRYFLSIGKPDIEARDLASDERAAAPLETAAA